MPDGTKAFLIYPADLYLQYLIDQRQYQQELEACPGWEDAVGGG